MASTVGMADIRGLDIDRLAKGFGKFKYNFLEETTVVKMKGDQRRWFQKSAGTLEAVSPSATKNVGVGATPTQLEVSWTRNTSYSKKYFVEGNLTKEDIEDAEIDTLATTIKDLTEVVVRDRDQDIYQVITEAGSPTNIQSLAITVPWDTIDTCNPLKDLLDAKALIEAQGYNPEGATLLLNPTDYNSWFNWLVTKKGSSIPAVSSEQIKKGVLMNIAGINFKKSLNVSADQAVLMIPKVATTYAEREGITAITTKEAGINSNIRIWARGIAYNTDPKAIVLLTNTQA